MKLFLLKITILVNLLIRFLIKYSLVNSYIPLKKLAKNEIKHKFKPWITLGLRNSKKRRDMIYKKYIKAKNSVIKNEYEKQYKTLRNQIVTLCRESKRLHFQNYFLCHANNIKNTRKGINQIINTNRKGEGNICINCKQEVNF